MSDYTGTPNLRPQGCGGASDLNDNSVSVCSDEITTISVSSNEITTICTTDSETYYIETPAVIGVPWVDITPEDAGKFLTNDGENPIWRQVAYSEENFTTEYKEALNEFISGNYVWKETSW